MSGHQHYAVHRISTLHERLRVDTAAAVLYYDVINGECIEQHEARGRRVVALSSEYLYSPSEVLRAITDQRRHR